MKSVFCLKLCHSFIGNMNLLVVLKDGNVWRTNKFMDVSQVSIHDSAEMRIWERRLIHCVPVISVFSSSNHCL